MKKLFAAAMLLFVFVASTSCDTIDDLLTFYINEEATIVVESNFPIGVVTPLSPVAVPTNSEETFKNNKTRAELVKDVTLNKLTLTTADTAASANFDFLESIDIYIEADGLDEVRVAYLDEMPENVKSVDLKLTNANLDEFLKKDQYTIKTRAKLRKAILKDISINAAMRFRVTADPI